MTATLNLKIMNTCDGGGHLNVRVQVDGVTRHNVTLQVTDITGTLLDDDVASAVALLFKAYARGRTGAQARTGLSLGVDIVVP